LWLPIPSAVLYAAAWIVRVSLPRRLKDRKDLPCDGHALARTVTALARLLLCSGSYVLCDVEVMEGKERVGVRVRLV
jgi:hypothetical protein